MKKHWYTMILIGSLIAVKGSALISHIPGTGVFSGNTASERLAFENETAPAAEAVPELPSSASPADEIPTHENTIEKSTDASSSAAETLPLLLPESSPADTIQPSDHSSEPVDFSSALFIGDSRTEGLKEYGGLTEAEFFASSGMSSFNLFSARLTVKDGSKQSLEELLSQRSYERIYLMLGINELGYPPSSVTKKYASIVDWIGQFQPQARIILEANLHVTKKKSDSDPVYGNGKIDTLNQAIYQMAVEKGCGYIDVNSLFDDGQGNLDPKYSVDNAHIMGKYYTVWAEWLRTQNV